MEQRAQPDKRQVNLDEIVNEPPIDNVRHHALGVEGVGEVVVCYQSFVELGQGEVEPILAQVGDADVVKFLRVADGG